MSLPNPLDICGESPGSGVANRVYYQTGTVAISGGMNLQGRLRISRDVRYQMVE